MKVQGVPLRARNAKLVFTCGTGLKISSAAGAKDFKSKVGYTIAPINEPCRNQDGSLTIPLHVDVSLDDGTVPNKTSLQNLERQLSCAVSFEAASDTYTEREDLTLYFYFPFAISHKSFTNQKGTFLIAHLESCLPCVMKLWEHSLSTNQKGHQLISVSAENYNSVLQSPTLLQPGQRLALMWRLAVNRSNKSPLPTVLLPCTASLQLAYSLSDSAARVKALRCTHFMQFHVQETFFTSALEAASNCSRPTHCVVGSFSEFDLRVRLANTTDAAAPEKPNDPSPSFRRLADGIISYSIVSDHKHWMIAGRVRGVFPAAEACDPKGFVTRVKLLPVSPGLLALPRIKLFWRSRREDQEQHMHADNLTRGVQVRVNPGVQHNSPLHVALY